MFKCKLIKHVMIIFQLLLFLCLIEKIHNVCINQINEVSGCSLSTPVTLTCIGSSKTIIVKNNDFSINSVLSEESFVTVNVSLCSTTFVEIEISSNVFSASGICSTSKRCIDTAISVVEIGNSTIVKTLNITNNIYTDDQFGSFDNRTRDSTTFGKNGIFISLANLTDIVDILNRTDYFEYNFNYKGNFQGESSYYFDRNYWLPGRIYDVLIIQYRNGTFGNETCEYACKDVCNSCVIDPTRYNSSSLTRCYNRTLFDSWAKMGYLCEHETVWVFPVEYSKESTTLVKSFEIIAMFWTVYLGEIDESNGFQLLSRPKILHDHDLEPNPIEGGGGNVPHSIYLNGDFLSFKDIDFCIIGEYESPFYGAILFSTSSIITEAVFESCEFNGSSSSVVLFNPIAMNNNIDNLIFRYCVIINIKFDIVPDILRHLEITNSNFFDLTNGIIDVEVLDRFIISNNTGFNITFNSLCESVICLKSTMCNTTGPCLFADNTFTGFLVIDELDLPLYTGVIYSIYNFMEVGIELENIFNNSDYQSFYGIEYKDMMKIPCSYVKLFEMKTLNPDVEGWNADIICDRDEVDEKSCSGLCILPLPPPPFCEVSLNFTMLNSVGFGHDKFNKLSDAIFGCSSFPIHHIFIHAGEYSDSGINFQPMDSETQTELLIEKIENPGHKVIIVGHTHTFSDQYEKINITGIEFHTSNFSASIPILICTSITNLFFGDVNDFFMKDVLLKAVEDPNNDVPCATYLMFMNFFGKDFVVENVDLRGSVGWGLLVMNQNPSNTTTFRLKNITGVGIWKTFIDLQDVSMTYAENLECINLCGGLALTEAVFRITNKVSGYEIGELVIVLNNIHIELNNPTLQVELVVPGGTGYMSTIWIENPNVGASFASKVEFRNIKVDKYPVGWRYLNIAEEILSLNEIGVPLLFDSKRGMRETARVNFIEGTNYDLKNGFPSVDDLLGDVNACNDLCLPVDSFVCFVSKEFNEFTFQFGTRRFNNIQLAINNCTVTLDPVPIKILKNGGSSTLRIKYDESLYFNETTRGTELIGEIDISTNILVSICGNHQIKTLISKKLILRNLELTIDENCMDSSVPVLRPDNPPSVIKHSLTLENVEVVVKNFDENDNSTGLMAPFALLEFGNLETVILRNTKFDKGFRLQNVDILTLKNLMEVIIDNLQFEHSYGPALRIENSDSVLMENSLFSFCAVGVNVLEDYCVFISIPNTGSIVMNENTLDRQAASIFSQRNGIFFTAFWLEFTTNIFVNTTGDLGTLRNITMWHMSNLIPVGIRINGVTFSPFFLSLPQLIQKKFPRAISRNNMDISFSLFHDVVINTKDDDIKVNTTKNERLFCTQGCPVSAQDISVISYLIIIGMAFLLLAILIILCPNGPYFLFPVKPEFVISSDLIWREKKRNDLLVSEKKES